MTTAVVPVPAGGTLMLGGGAVIAPVAAESAFTELTEFVPVTSTRIRFPTSTSAGT